MNVCVLWGSVGIWIVDKQQLAVCANTQAFDFVRDLIDRPPVLPLQRRVLLGEARGAGRAGEDGLAAPRELALGAVSVLFWDVVILVG
jgi:hypothetical protein